MKIESILGIKSLLHLIRLIYLITPLILPFQVGSARESEPSPHPFSLYLELGGEGIGLSLNADYRIHPNFSFRMGASTFLFGYSIPFTLSLLTPANPSHHFELGLGAAFGEVAGIFGGEREPVVYFPAILGYRYQPEGGGFLFRFSFTPLFVLVEQIIPLPSEGEGVRLENKRFIVPFPFAGISLGYNF